MTPLDAIEARLRGERWRDAPLAPRTTIRAGGPADLLVRPADPDDLSTLLRLCRAHGVPLLALGAGSNLLVAGRGVRGVVVKLPRDFGVASGAEPLAPGRLLLSAGAPAARMVALAGEQGLVGCEFAAGVPGTVGGLVAMNAGTRAGEMKDIVRRAELASPDGAGWVTARELAFGYRTARLPLGALVTRLEVELPGGDVAASAAAMRADLARRRATQPLGWPNFGSTFRNPPGAFAGQLIEAVGLRGHREGGAAWSELHANFIVNLGGATPREVCALVRLARERVKEAFGVELVPEVRLVGELGEGERFE